MGAEGQLKISRSLTVLGFLAVALQRFTLGASGVQFSTVIMLIVIGLLIITARLRASLTNILLLVALVISAYLSFLLAPAPASITSLLLFLSSYALVIFRGLEVPGIRIGERLFSGTVVAVKVGALLGVAQFFCQKVGLGYFDPIQNIGSQWLVSGFNSYYDLEFSGGRKGEYKPNGILFLEPSFLSLYSAVALVYVFVKIFQLRHDNDVKAQHTKELRGNIFWATVLIVSIAVSSSTSGLVVLGLALIPLLLAVRRNRAILIFILALAFIAAAMGLFSSLIAKAGEGFSGNTSTALRLTRPYELLTPFWLERPFVGWGPGSAAEAVRQISVPGLQATTAMKALVEYGLAGSLILSIIVLAILYTSTAPLPVRIAILAAWLIPGDNLLNSTLVLMLLLMMPNWDYSIMEKQDYRIISNHARITQYSRRYN
jgi:hypothetical protein